MKNSKILVIMPVYNQEKYVELAIESVLQQTYSEFHLVIINDYSSDNSLKIINQYRNNPSITILENDKNMGCYYSRNRGLYEFKDGDWDLFTIHDPDDISDITRFEKIVPDFDDISLMGLRTTYISVTGDDLKYVITRDGTYDTYASEGIAWYTRYTFDTIGYFDDTRYSGDSDYYRRVQYYCKLNKSYRNSIHPTILYFRRMHDTNLTVLHPIESRTKYYEKMSKDIQQMYKENNFYRYFLP